MQPPSKTPRAKTKARTKTQAKAESMPVVTAKTRPKAKAKTKPKAQTQAMTETKDFIPVVAASPPVHLANPEACVAEIMAFVKEAAAVEPCLMVFPELALTGATCADLFFQPLLIEGAKKELLKLVAKTKKMKTVFVVGLPLQINNALYNVAAVFSAGRILGIVPKVYDRNTPCHEKRWFSNGCDLKAFVQLGKDSVPCNPQLTFSLPLSTHHSSAPAYHSSAHTRSPYKVEVVLGDEALVGRLQKKCANTVIANPHATLAIAAPLTYEERVQAYIESNGLHVVRAGAGEGESTTDYVLNGTCFLCAPQEIPLSFSETGWFATYFNKRSFKKSVVRAWKKSALETSVSTRLTPQDRAKPFTTANPEIIKHVVDEAFSIQTKALMQRLQATGIKKVVIGISGGLDSTLALLVCHNAFSALKIPAKNMYAVSMPGFGTTKKTKSNAHLLAEALGATYQEIPIGPALKQHFKDIEHDSRIKNAAYENAQARERTQILMDRANDLGALVIGTGDMSEAALGWTTFNGDHMSMYNVNAGVPKTLVTSIVQELSVIAAEKSQNKLASTLDAIVKTPISPELLPPSKKGVIQQKTEEVVGPYDLHDFFLYHAICEQRDPKDILRLAKRAFPDVSDKTLVKWLRVFYKRFFSQQFKRSCAVDGPQIVSFSLSPRTGFEMPSDARADLWLSQLK